MEEKKIRDDDVNIKYKSLGQPNNSENMKIRDLEEAVKAQRKEIESLKSVNTINEAQRKEIESLKSMGW